jgi:hypothetical protein
VYGVVLFMICCAAAVMASTKKVKLVNIACRCAAASCLSVHLLQETDVLVVWHGVSLALQRDAAGLAHMWQHSAIGLNLAIRLMMPYSLLCDPWLCSVLFTTYIPGFVHNRLCTPCC